MFNFTGQVKRRNVNLGTSNRASTKDLIAKAKREREKRAQDRLEIESIQSVQSAIRKFLTIKKALTFLLNNSEDPKLPHIIPLFGDRILTHLNQNQIQTVLSKSLSYLVTYPNNLGNIKLLSLVGSFTNDSLLCPTLSSLNPNYPLSSYLIQQLHNFISQTNSLCNSSSNAIINIIQMWNVLDDNSFIKIFEIDSSKIQSPESLMNLLEILGSAKLIPFQKSTEPSYLENISFIYDRIEDKSAVARLISLHFNNTNYELTGSPLQIYVRNLFEKPFSDKFISMFEDQFEETIDINTLVSFVSCSVLFKKRDSIIISLLSRKLFLKIVYEQNFRFPFRNLINGESFCFLFFLNILETYLLVTTDQELMYNKDKFSIEELIEFTTNLRDFVFERLWDQNNITDDSILDTALALLKKIYFRDSRLNFCNNKDSPGYWSSQDNEFLNINIFKYLHDYESIYRDYADKKEDLNESSNISSNNIHINTIAVFNQYKEINLNSSSTRQFKKLEILMKAPFFIPFDQRVDLFYTFIAIDKHRLSLDTDNNMFDSFSFWNTEADSSRASITISRESVLEDAFKSFNNIGEKLKSKLAVTFVNEFGPEAGIDGGGITKEFLTSVSEEGFKDENSGLFEHNDQFEIYPFPNINTNQLKYLWFLGKIVGKCLYDRVLIDVNFADFFVKKLLNYSNNFISSFDDLSSFDSELYQNLVKLFGMNSAELESLDLTFELTKFSEKNKVVELIPNGSNIRVTKSNLLQYIFLVSDYKLNKSEFRQLEHFHGGMSIIIAPHWMELFNSVELQMLISGGGRNIDLEDLEKNTIYGGFEESEQTIRDFWQVLLEFEPEQRLNFIKFVTSVPRGPLQGFGSLNPKFGIRNSGSEKERLPTASTCVNLLKLPDYRNKALLKEKLLYAINSGARFDLS